MAATVELARAAGVFRSEVTDDQVRDLLFGPAIYRWLMLGDMPTPDEVDRLLDLALAAL